MRVKDSATGQIHNFPDNATPEQIAQAMRAYDKNNSSARNETDTSDMVAPSKNSIAHAFSKAFGQTEDFGKYLPTHPVADLKDVAQGVVEGLVAAPQNLFRAESSVFPEKLLNNSYVQAIRNKDWTKATAPIGSGRQGGASDFLRGVGQYAPVTGLEGDVQEALAKLLPNAAEEIPKVAARLGIGAAGGLATPEKNPDDVSQDMLWSSLLNALIPGGGDAISSFLEKRRPSVKLRGTLSPEKLQENMQAARGTSTALGDVIQSPKLKKKYENVIYNLPYSNAEEKMKGALAATNNKAQNVMENILGTHDLAHAGDNLDEEGQHVLQSIFGGEINPDNATSDLVNHIKEKYTESKAIKNKEYKKRNEIANNDPNFRMMGPKFADAVNKYHDSIGDLVLLKNEPDEKALFNKLASYKGPFKNGFPKDAKNKIGQDVTLDEAQRLKAKLSDYGRIAEGSPDMTHRSTAGVYNNLASQLNEDIHDSIKASGNKKLAAQQAKADKFFKENFLPFLNKNIYKFVNGRSDPDTIVNSLIKTGPDSDRSTLLASGMALPGEMSELLGKAYFSRAFNKDDGLVNRDKLSKLISKLGNNQFKELMPLAGDRQSLLDFNRKNNTYNYFKKAINSDGSINLATLSRLAENLFKSPRKASQMLGENESDLRNFRTLQQMNKDIPAVLANQPTGKTGLSWAGIMSSLLPIIGGASAGHLLEGAATSAALGSYLAARGRIKTNAMTSEAAREALIKLMLENKTKFKAGGPLTKAAQISAMSAATSGGR